MFRPGDKVKYMHNPVIYTVRAVELIGTCVNITLCEYSDVYPGENFVLVAAAEPPAIKTLPRRKLLI